MRLDELAKACGATLLGGDPARGVRAAASLADAGPADIAHCSDPRFVQYLSQTKAAGVFVGKDESRRETAAQTALLLSEDPEMAFLEALRLLYPRPSETRGVDERACVEPGAQIGRQVHIGPYAVIRSEAEVGDGSAIGAGAYIGRACRLGKHCVIHPRAVLYDGVILGHEVVVHAGAVLGADGFGYKFRAGGHVKVPQVGGLRIGDRVEIGANACIDRAALGETVISEGVKIDNLVQVGHNCRIGKHVILCGQAGVAGSVIMDDYVVMGANAGISDHLHIGTAARIGAKAGVIQDLPAHAEVWGLPCDERARFWRQVAAMRKLPELLKRVRELEQRLEEIEKRK